MAGMLDLNFIAENPDQVSVGLRNRGAEVDLSEVAKLNEERKRLQTRISEMRHDHRPRVEKNRHAVSREEKEEAEALRAHLRSASDAIKAVEEQQREIEKSLNLVLMTIPAHSGLERTGGSRRIR